MAFYCNIVRLISVKQQFTKIFEKRYLEVCSLGNRGGRIEGVPDEEKGGVPS